jgi:membrane-associated protein
VNYFVGRLFGEKLSVKFPRIIKPKYLEETHAFYERYGGLTIIITRFVPIVRTFAPFVAGAGRMKYLKFTAYNIAGGVLWIASLLFLGYFFGNIPPVKKNFSLVIMAIVIVSVLPIAIGLLRKRRKV